MSGAVIVGNVRHRVPEGYTPIYVGRCSSYKPAFGEDFSVLGNPYVMPKYTREEAIEGYKRWLKLQVRTRGNSAYEALKILALRVQSGDKLALLCFCHPQHCHAEIIKEALEATL